MAVTFEEWMSRESPALKRAADLLCRDEHKADDLVLEALVRVYVKWARISGMDNPACYAQQTLTKVNLSRWRRLRRDRSKAELFAVDDASSVKVEEGTDRATMRMWLRTLGAKQRAAVMWRYYYDRPIPEIATLLGYRESTVRTQLTRALANLRRSADVDGTETRKGEHHDAR